MRRARSVLVVTGAGMSADSGLPTYRGVGGLYDRGPTADGVAIEEALSGTMLLQRPELCWKYLQEIERSTRGREPNAGHRALVAMEAHFDRLTVLTQNVDGFHRAAGSSDVIEIHGNLQCLHCTACPYEVGRPEYVNLQIPPLCPWCAAPIRPRVVLFGEALPEAECGRLHQVLAQGPDLVLSVGTSSVFPYIVQPVLLAARQDRPTVEINPGDTEVSDLVRYRIRNRAARVLPALLELLKARP